MQTKDSKLRFAFWGLGISVVLLLSSLYYIIGITEFRSIDKLTRKKVVSAFYNGDKEYAHLIDKDASMKYFNFGDKKCVLIISTWNNKYVNGDPIVCFGQDFSGDPKIVTELR